MYNFLISILCETQSTERLTPRFRRMRNFACVFTEKVYNNSLTKRTFLKSVQ